MAFANSGEIKEVSACLQFGLKTTENTLTSVAADRQLFIIQKGMF